MWTRNILKSIEEGKRLLKEATNLDKKALKRSLWGSLSRVIGVGLGAGAGGLLHQLVGDGLGSYSIAFILAGASFVFMWIAEYEREKS
jgi:hypothetical protein